MPKILKFGEEAIESLLRGVGLVSAAVSTTLGPRGNNVAIDRKWGAPIVVHDGVTVAEEIDVADPYENMGVQLVKEAARKTNDRAGDGTTTATVLTKAIVTEALKNIAAGSSAMMLRKGIEAGVERVVSELAKMAKPIKTAEEVESIAIISAQDEQIGRVVAQTVNKLGKDAVIAVEESSTVDISVEYKEGMEFDRGFISPYFITNAETQDAIIENAYILITDKQLSSMQDFLPFIEGFMKAPKAHGHNLIVIGEQVSGEVLATLIVNKIKGVINSLAITAPGFGDKRKKILEDIAILTGGRFISQETGEKLESVTLNDLGRAGKVVSSKDFTRIIDGKGNPDEIKKRIAAIKLESEKPNISEFDKEKLLERLAKLTSGVAVINIGANSEAEMKEKKERAIDAVNATKAALAEGIVPGGLVALLKAADAIKLDGTREVELGEQIVKEACKEPFKTLMTNSGYDAGQMLERLVNTGPNEGVDVIDGLVKDLVKAGIVDPVMVTRSALQNAASAAVMIMTTKVLIAEGPESDKENNSNQKTKQDDY